MKTILILVLLTISAQFVLGKDIKEYLRKVAQASNGKEYHQDHSAKLTVNYSTGYFSQTIDHFNYNANGVNSKTFNMRYIYNGQYWGGASSLSNKSFHFI
jgi:hypothetical protein